MPIAAFADYCTVSSTVVGAISLGVKDATSADGTVIKYEPCQVKDGNGMYVDYALMRVLLGESGLYKSGDR